jgi:hypothetical protein
MQSGELNQEEIMKKVSVVESKEKIQLIYNLCKEVKGANDCETAYKLYECYVTYKNRNKIYY